MTGWLTRRPTTRTEEDRAGLKEVLARCRELEQAAEHVRDLGEILTARLGSPLPTWIDAVDARRLPGLTGLHSSGRVLKSTLNGRFPTIARPIVEEPTSSITPRAAWVSPVRG
ncbi:hypothetical protein ACFC00_19325 [Streptomyces adustus]|uniref:hypothetical protein n=1 Tax=Streptomyces adustus TaxID=1609272 RepID=UPI0035DF0B5B